MKKLEQAYSNYISSLDDNSEALSKENFLEHLKNDDTFNKKFGKSITRSMSLGERLELAYSDKEERMQTLIFMGTKHTKKLLNKIKIPKRKILRSDREIKEFLSNNN